MSNTLPLLLSVGSGIVAGVFFAFSTFVMKALAQLPACQGIAAMQRINIVVLNPFFIGAFVGTAVLASIAILLGVLSVGDSKSWLLLVAGAFYLVGCFGVTMVFNVPRNNRLASMDSQSAEAVAYWPTYVREWTLWNHVRTLAPIVAAGCAAAAMGY